MTSQPELPAPGSVAWSEPESTTPAPALYRMSLTKVTSMLVVTQQRRVVTTGTVEQLEDAYRKVVGHNLMFGWWGIPFGLIWTPLALVKNRKNMATIRALAATKSAAPAPTQ